MSLINSLFPTFSYKDAIVEYIVCSANALYLMNPEHMRVTKYEA